MTDERPTMLLVHGAWHGPWVWADLQAELGALGWRTRTVQLPSSSRTADPAGVGPGVAEDAAAVRRAIDDIGGPVVVLAHSYGGIPVSQATAGATEVVHVVAWLPTSSTRGEHVLLPRRPGARFVGRFDADQR